MNFLLIGGQPNTGKSETLERIYLILSQRYTVITNTHPFTALPPNTPLEDFSAILEGIDIKGQQVKILLHSPSDDDPSINLLEANIDKYQPDIVISSVRDIHRQRDRVLKIVGANHWVEFPLARITRRLHQRNEALDWYRRSVDALIYAELRRAPYNLML